MTCSPMWSRLSHRVAVIVSTESFFNNDAYIRFKITGNRIHIAVYTIEKNVKILLPRNFVNSSDKVLLFFI